MVLRPSQQPLRRTFRRPSVPGDSVDFDAHQESPMRGPVPGPERDLRDPAPTVAVPYRVIQRPAQTAPDVPREPVSRAAVDTSASAASSDWGDDPDRNW